MQINNEIVNMYFNQRGKIGKWVSHQDVRMSPTQALKIISNYGKDTSRTLLTDVLNDNRFMQKQLSVLATRSYILETIVYEQLFSELYFNALYSIMLYSLIGRPTSTQNMIHEFVILTNDKHLASLAKCLIE